jgi:hypothetical protein
MEQWKSLANENGLGFPIGKPAQAKRNTPLLDFEIEFIRPFV